MPRDLIESMYGKEIDQETASALVSETFREAVAERSLSPVTRPDVTDMDALEAGKEFGYSAHFEVMPEFELSDYGSMSLTKNAYEATEEEIDGELESLRERSAQTSLLEDDRPAPRRRLRGGGLRRDASRRRDDRRPQQGGRRPGSGKGAVSSRSSRRTYWGKRPREESRFSVLLPRGTFRFRRPRGKKSGSLSS